MPHFLRPHYLQSLRGAITLWTRTPNQSGEEASSILVEWFAGQIPNPVHRLRFLRAVMSTRDKDRKPYKFWLLVALLILAASASVPAIVPRVRAVRGIEPLPAAARATVPAVQTPEIWQVERTNAFETYSNGLRIENQFSIPNRRRSYLVFSAARPEDTQGERRFLPAGIVFHTTESLQAPFEAGQNSALKRIGESLLAYVRLKRAYNFVIDRFGRVYRVVLETDAADHAGISVWADPEWLYLNLNQSFLAVSFETQTLPGQVETAVNPAQVRAAAMLTDMLRKRYGITAGNCVTHAPISVNVSNLQIGLHTDWASSFPFEQLGLPDNYATPLPAVSQFGFESDANFAHQGGARLYQGVQLAEQVLRDRAAASHMSVPNYRKALQKRYGSQLATVRSDANEMDQEAK